MAQRDQARAGRRLLVAADLCQGTIIPAGDAAAWMAGQGEQALGPDPDRVDQVPHVYRGRQGPLTEPAGEFDLRELGACRRAARPMA